MIRDCDNPICSVWIYLGNECPKCGIVGHPTDEHSLLGLKSVLENQ